MKGTKQKNKFLHASSWWKYLLSAVIIAIYLLPIYSIIVISLKPVTDHTSRLLLPDTLYLDNYFKVINSGGLLNAIKNTMLITLVTTTLEVFVGCMAAYPLARNKSRINKFIKILILGVMMIPPLSIVVGVYSTLVSMDAISTYWGIILVITAFGLPQAIFLYSNFMASIPVSLDEAAIVDGSNIMQTFLYVILPQLKPVTVTVIILKSVAAWNEYSYSRYILQTTNMYNVTLTIKQYFSEMQSDLNAAAAAAVLAIAPVVVIYLFLQRYFIQGEMDGAVKG